MSSAFNQEGRYKGLAKLTDEELDAKIAVRFEMLVEQEERLRSIERAHKRAVDEKNYRLDKAKRTE